MATGTKYLIIGGSTKCGTTSVFKYFEFHPEICACMMKESRYFLEDEYKLKATQRNHNTNSNFDSLFSNCKNESVKLEATPDYLYSSKAVTKIKNELEQVKLVFILRDPVDRLRSWYKFAMLNGLIEATISFEDYINLQKAPAGAHTPQHLRSLEQGRYAEYLENYLQAFGKENIKVCFYEQLELNPGLFCTELAAFAGIDPGYFNNFDFKVHNRSVAVKSVGAHKLFRKFKRSVRPATRLLPVAIRKKLKLAGYNLEQAYSNANRADEMNDISLSDSMKQYLQQYYQSDIRHLIRLTNSNPEWSTQNLLREK